MFDRADALLLSLFAATVCGPTSFAAILSRRMERHRVRAGKRKEERIAPSFKLGHHNARSTYIQRHRRGKTPPRLLLRRRPRVNQILVGFCVSSASRPINYTPAEIYRATEREKPRSGRYSRRSFFAAVIARCRLLIALTHWLAAGEVTDSLDRFSEFRRKRSEL